MFGEDRERSLPTAISLQEFYLVMHFASITGANFFKQDNTRPHVVVEVMDYFREVNNQVMDWPPKNLDLNPIDYM